MPRRSSTILRRRDKVVSVLPMKGIPVGTHGVVKTVAGQTWTRYWVAWETGEWTGTVDGKSIVREDRLEEYGREQAAAALAATAAAALTATASAGGEESDGGGGGGRVPEHLLERSRQARARVGASGGG